MFRSGSLSGQNETRQRDGRGTQTKRIAAPPRHCHWRTFSPGKRSGRPTHIITFDHPLVRARLAAAEPQTERAPSGRQRRGDPPRRVRLLRTNNECRRRMAMGRSHGSEVRVLIFDVLVRHLFGFDDLRLSVRVELQGEKKSRFRIARSASNPDGISVEDRGIRVGPATDL
jgi:hypothetical protein